MAKKLSQGDIIILEGERMKVGVLGPGNATAGKDGKVKGILAIVQWYKRGEPYEKIAYNVTAPTIDLAHKVMAGWMPKLQYHEYRETSLLLRLVKDEGTVVRD